MKHLLKIAITLVTTLLVVSMPFASASAQPTAADQAFVSEITGDEVDLGMSGDIEFIEENYEFRETQSFQEEYIWFTTGWSNFQLVLIAGPNESADYHEVTLANMQDFYDSWELVDEEVSEEQSWFLGNAELNGSPLVVYYEFELDAFGDVDLVTVQFTDISSFQADLEFAQSEVTIGGEPLLPDTNAAGLVALAGGESATPDSSPEPDTGGESDSGLGRISRGGSNDTDADDGTTDSEDDADSERSRTSRGGSTDSDTDEDDGSGDGVSRTSRGGDSDTEEDDTTAPDDGDSDRSRTTRGGSSDSDVEDDDTTDSDDDVESDRSRTTRGGSTDVDEEDDADSERSRSSRDGSTDTESTPVSGGNWDSMGLVSDTEWESPNHGNIVTWDAETWEFPHDYDAAIIINDDPPYDVLTLQTTDGSGYVYLTVDLAYDGTPQGTVDFWTSEDYLSGFTNEVTVLETGTTPNSATMVYETTNLVDEPLIVVMEATYLEDGTAIFSQISAAPATIHEVYAQFVDGVEVDGVPLELTFTVEDIRDIAGN